MLFGCKKLHNVPFNPFGFNIPPPSKKFNPPNNRSSDLGARLNFRTNLLPAFLVYVVTIPFIIPMIALRVELFLSHKESKIIVKDQTTNKLRSSLHLMSLKCTNNLFHN